MKHKSEDYKLSAVEYYLVFEKALELSSNYTKYWKQKYTIDKIIIKTITNRNPHIKINI